MNDAKLTIELVPETCWYSNVRSEVSKEQWDKIKSQVSNEAWGVCEICGGKGDKWPVECHEVWHYDDEKHIQTLIRMTALCPACHEVKHIGFAQTRGRGEIALKHLAKVNKWTIAEANAYLTASFIIWTERSQHQWALDISILKKYGVKINDEDNR